MGAVINRTTKEVRRSVDVNDYNPAQWVRYSRALPGTLAKLNALAVLLASVLDRHVKFDGSDNPSEMTAGEKTVADAATLFIKLTSNAALDFDGIPAVNADNVAVHAITAQKVDLSGNNVNTGSETLRLLGESELFNASSGNLVNGARTVNTRAFATPRDVTFTVYDAAGVLKPATLKVRFK